MPQVDVPALPSWVPNWAQPTITRSLGRNVDYRISDGLKMQWSIEHGTHTLGDCFLKMQALRIGVVSTTGIDVTITNGCARSFYENLHETVAGIDSIYTLPQESYHEALIKTLTAWYPDEDLSDSPLNAGTFDGLEESLKLRIEDLMIGRRAVITQNGFIGLAPRASRVGDVVFIVPDCRLPMVMRHSSCSTKVGAPNQHKHGRESCGHEACYQLIGACCEFFPF